MAFAAILLGAFHKASAEVKFALVDGEATGVAPALRAWRERSGYTWIWGVTAWEQDGDGKMDLILTTHQSSPLTGSIVLRGDGAGKFRDVTAELGLAEKEMPHEYRPVVIDVDRDGRRDLLHSTQGTGRAVFNLGESLVLGGATFDLSSKAGRITDANADGFPDFVQLHRDYGTSRIDTFLNDQTGGFVKITREQPIPLAVPEQVVERLMELRSDTATANRYCGPRFWEADLDGDGSLDVAMQYAGSYAHGAQGKAYRIGWYSVDLGISPETIPLEVRDVTGDGVAEVFAGYGPGGGVYVGGKLIANADLNKTLSMTSPRYLTKLEWYDFDEDGDDDLLVSTQRLGWLELYENQGGGGFAKALRAHHWDAEGWAVADFNGDGMLDLAIGGTGPSKPSGWPVPDDTNFTLYLNAAAPPVPPPPPFEVRLRHPLETADPAAPETQRFLKWCDLPNPYGLDAFRLALAYRISGERRYAERSAAMVNAYVAAAKTAIDAGNKPAIARNSYLNVYRETRAIIFPLLWCAHEFTREEKESAEAVVKQAVWNIWHPKEATWGGKPQPWSGWATSDPENNYHFSFVGAEALLQLLAISGVDAGGLAAIRDRLRSISDVHGHRGGGGSREGTGYGLSHATLYEVFGIWLDSTGEHFPAIEQHARDSIDYWVHATTPDGKFVATIGDQARKSEGPVYDYHRATILWAKRMARPVDWESVDRVEKWLAVHQQMNDGFNFHDDLGSRSRFAQPAPAGGTIPISMSHSAPGVGHYFARSSWDADATFLVFQAGVYNQSHAHQSQGAFDLWGAGRWLTQTQNARTRSGIQQGTEWHNMLRFERDGIVLPQKYRGQVSATVTDDGETWQAEAAMDGMYPTVGITWTRKITFARKAPSVCVRDDWDGADDVQAVWQLQLPVEPTINEEGSVLTAGNLRATIDAGGPVSVKDWKLLSSDAVAGWRVELRDGERKGFDVTLEVVP